MAQYLGRIVAVGQNASGTNVGVYRLSSRSFPNRQIVDTKLGMAVVPRDGCEADVLRNPYVAYNCLRIVGDVVVITNGSHTDPIAEKIASGMTAKDALVQALSVLDYEKDELNTPRIAGVLPRAGGSAWLGVVRADALVVRTVALRPGVLAYVSTYEACDIREDLQVVLAEADAKAIAAASCRTGDAVGLGQFPHAVAGAAVVATATGFETAHVTAPAPA